MAISFSNDLKIDITIRRYRDKNAGQYTASTGTAPELELYEEKKEIGLTVKRALQILVDLIVQW